MAQTSVPAGSSLAVKEYSVALFVQMQKQPGLAKNLTGPSPQIGDAEAKLRLQSSPDMPIVKVTDLAKTAGDTVTVDCIDITAGPPVMGDRNAEGMGEKLTFSSMEGKIDLITKPIDAGGKMSQKRTKHDLRRLARANAIGWMTRYRSHLLHMHMGGARGSLAGATFPIGLQYASAVTGAADPQFSDYVVNALKAPSFSRHYGVSATGVLTPNGASAPGIDGHTTAGALDLDTLDQLRVILDEQELPIQPVRIADDQAAYDDPLNVLLVSPRVWNGIKAANSGQLRTFQQNAWNRASYGSKHPLFMGEVGLWNGILVKKVSDFWIRFYHGDTTFPYVRSGNAATATETTAYTVACGASNAVDRCLLLGAQALADIYGNTGTSDLPYSWLERMYNFERATEIAVEMMNGVTKMRFDVPQADGTKLPTDHGVIAIDTIVAL